MPRLYDLDVSGITVTDGVVSALARNAPHIRRLNVSRTRVSGAFATHLGALNLSLLRARGVTYMNQPVLGDYIAQAGVCAALDICPAFWTHLLNRPLPEHGLSL
jgi:hypothetical protein